MLAWYDLKKRDLPWRKSRDFYAVWVSEVMLQQTTVKAVLGFYARWMDSFPTVESLAVASDSDVTAHWAGLGYYSRCRRLHDAAKVVAKNGWPKSSQEWLQLPGVGKYTAHAVSSICLDEPVAVVDGNVERVFARVSGSDLVGSRLKTAAWKWADKYLEQYRPGDWNQAVMELGATVCTPRNPKCHDCPIADHCLSFKNGEQQLRPLKAPKLCVKFAHHRIWIPVFENRLGVEQAPEGQWWAGLWGFPRRPIEVDVSQELEACSVVNVGTFKHTVTNHNIAVEVVVVECDRPTESLTWVSLQDLDRLAMPSPQRKAFKLWSDWSAGLDRQPALFDAKRQEAINQSKSQYVETDQQHQTQDLKSVLSSEPLLTAKA